MHCMKWVPDWKLQQGRIFAVQCEGERKHAHYEPESQLRFTAAFAYRAICEQQGSLL